MSKGEQTRQRIIEQAAPLFNSKGYDGTCMQDVLAATGLEKGGLYRHFASKEELALAAFQYALDQMRTRRIEGLEKVEGALDKLRFLVDRFVEVPSPVAGGCPLMNVAAGEGSAAVLALAGEGLAVWQERLVGIVRKGIRAGEVRAEVDARVVAHTIIAMLEGSLMVARLEGTRRGLRVARGVLGEVIDGLGV